MIGPIGPRSRSFDLALLLWLWMSFIVFWFGLSIIREEKGLVVAVAVAVTVAVDAATAVVGGSNGMLEGFSFSLLELSLVGEEDFDDNSAVLAVFPCAFCLFVGGSGIAVVGDILRLLLQLLVSFGEFVSMAAFAALRFSNKVRWILI